MSQDKRSALHLNGLPANLAVLGDGAFMRSGNNVIITELPPNLKELSSWSLSRCNGVNISQFGTNTGEGLTTILTGALYESGPNVEEVYLGKSITTLGSIFNYNTTTGEVSNSSNFGAFSNYGKLSNLYSANYAV